MQNTHDNAGDQDKIDAGMVAINADRDEWLATLQPKIEALPDYASLDTSKNTRHHEPGRMVFDVTLEAPAGQSGDEVAKKFKQGLRDAMTQPLMK